MSFINEIVSEEDVKAHGLDDIMRVWDARTWRQGRPFGFVYQWTIDRGRNVFLLPIQTLEEAGPSGRLEPTWRSLWFLNWKGHWIRVILNRTPGSSINLTDDPFHIDWALVSVDLSSFTGATRDEVIAALKDALSTFGYRGALRQVPQTLVRFSF